MRYFDRAALFVEACLKYGVIPVTEDTDILHWVDYAEGRQVAEWASRRSVLRSTEVRKEGGWEGRVRKKVAASLASAVRWTGRQEGLERDGTPHSVKACLNLKEILEDKSRSRGATLK